MTARERYGSLEAQREDVLTRGRDAAKLTIPGLLPESGHNETSRLPTPFQSVGARGVNNLTSKLLLALFPPGNSFFKLSLDEKLIRELTLEEKGTDVIGEFDKALSGVERAVTASLDGTNARTTIAQALKLLIVTGNALLQILPKSKLKVHPIDSFVVKRDLEGDPIEIVVKEGLSPLALPPEVAAIADVDEGSDAAAREDKGGEKVVWIYTRASLDREAKVWNVFQEVKGEKVEGSEGTWPMDRPAFLPLRWSAVDGEDYGRGLCEEYLGDLISLESLTQAITEFAAASAKILFMVNEAGVTDKRKLMTAPSGAIVDGDARDVTVLQLEKAGDFQIADAVAQRIEQRIAQAFLLNSSIQRQAERVTAEEIRFMAGELEAALGGTYSTLAQELQRPLVNRIMLQLQKEGTLPSLPDKSIRPTIVTGLEGLGRQGDLMKLDVLVKGVGEIFGPEAVAQWVKAGPYIQRRAAALGINIDGVVKTEEEVQAEQAQAQQAALQERAVGPAINAASAQAQAQPEAPTEEA
jgi:hypothetical protein